MKDYESKMKDANIELRFHKQNLESEINLRMKFEERLNLLHSLNRTFNDTASKNDKKLKEKDMELKEIHQERLRLMKELTDLRAAHEECKQELTVVKEKGDMRLMEMRRQRLEI